MSNKIFDNSENFDWLFNIRSCMYKKYNLMGVGPRVRKVHENLYSVGIHCDGLQKHLVRHITICHSEDNE